MSVTRLLVKALNEHPGTLMPQGIGTDPAPSLFSTLEQPVEPVNLLHDDDTPTPRA